MTEPLHDTESDHMDTESDHMVETPESLRDGDPEAPALDRGVEATDRPLGAENFGTTHAEAEQGEPLDDRLAEEVPDVGEHDPVDDIVAADPVTFARDEADAAQTDDTVLADAYGGPEKDAVADDVGADGGGMSAEEAALRVEGER